MNLSYIANSESEIDPMPEELMQVETLSQVNARDIGSFHRWLLWLQLTYWIIFFLVHQIRIRRIAGFVWQLADNVALWFPDIEVEQINF